MFRKNCLHLSKNENVVFGCVRCISTNSSVSVTVSLFNAPTQINNPKSVHKHKLQRLGPSLLSVLKSTINCDKTKQTKLANIRNVNLRFHF